jgi:hypothetical protein
VSNFPDSRIGAVLGSPMHPIEKFVHEASRPRAATIMFVSRSSCLLYSISESHGEETPNGTYQWPELSARQSFMLRCNLCFEPTLKEQITNATVTTREEGRWPVNMKFPAGILGAKSLDQNVKQLGGSYSTHKSPRVHRIKKAYVRQLDTAVRIGSCTVELPG